MRDLQNNKLLGTNLRKRGGLELIEEFEDPYNRKLKRWVLSSKGVKFFKQLNYVSENNKASKAS